MFKSIRLLATAAFTLACASAQAGYVSTANGVNFTYQGVDANTFTVRIQNALDATGSWTDATHLGYLAVKGLGAMSGLTGVSVSIASVSGISWSYTRTELNSNGCNTSGGGTTLCLDANPDVPLSNDLLFTIDLLGSGINISGVTAPQLKVGFTALQSGSYAVVGDLSTGAMTLAATSSSVPEPASLALAGLALAGACAARRRIRG